MGEDALLLLHEIRLRGLVTLEDDAVAVQLVDAGLVARGPRGASVTAAGRALHATWARLGAGSEPEVVARRTYERFLPLNRELLQLCSDWQVRPGGVANDHRDAGYDWGVLDRLRTLDERCGPVVSRLGREVARFADYRTRLRSALARVDDGDHQWFTSPRIDSYHTVWMYLHEDLLFALGVDRESEPQP